MFQISFLTFDSSKKVRPPNKNIIVALAKII